MIKPTSRLLWILLAWLLLAVACVFVPQLKLVWRMSTFVGAVIVAVDVLWLLQLSQKKHISIERTVNKNLPVYSWSHVTLEIKHAFLRSVRIRVHDHHPTSMAVQGLPVDTVLPKEQGVRIPYRIKPLERGDDQFVGTDIMVFSLLGLWQRRRFFKGETEVKIYPNFAQIAKYTLLATDNRLSQMGLKRKQRRGLGQDFHQLREYRLGDSVKQINWKATSRHNKLISREFQDERDQQIIFLLDCGRRMRHVGQGQAHLDQALNAMLLLSYVASQQGDATGFLSFAGQEKWFAPEKGTHIVRHILNKSYDLQSTTQAADYVTVAKKLLTLQKKRSLVVLITNTRDEDNSELQQALKLLSRKHLVVLADLQEPELSKVMTQPIQDLDSALLYQSVSEYLHERKRAHERLSHIGAICLDTTAKALPITLVNSYLDIKDSGRL